MGCLTWYLQKIHEFQALDSSSLSGVVYDMARMRRLLEITLAERCKTHADPLPRYFLVEEIVSIVLLLCRKIHIFAYIRLFNTLFTIQNNTCSQDW